MAVNTNAGVADLGKGVSDIGQGVSKMGQEVSEIGQGMLEIGQGMSKLLENSGSQNTVVCDMCIFYLSSTYADRCSGSEQVRNLDYREIQV